MLLQDKFEPAATPEERLRMLRDNADNISKGEYTRKLTTDELNQAREEYTDASVEINNLEDELKESTKDLKDRIKELKAANRESLKVIRQRFKTLDGEIFYFIDPVEGMVSGYDATGERVEHRKMKPSERQGTVMQMRRAASE
jgi:hypothetical protein